MRDPAASFHPAARPKILRRSSPDPMLARRAAHRFDLVRHTVTISHTSMTSTITRMTAMLMLAAALSGIIGCKSDIWADQPAQVIAEYRVPNSAKVVTAGTEVLEMTAPEQGII